VQGRDAGRLRAPGANQAHWKQVLSCRWHLAGLRVAGCWQLTKPHAAPAGRQRRCGRPRHPTDRAKIGVHRAMMARPKEVAGNETRVSLGPTHFTDWVLPHVGAMARLAARLAPSDRDDIVQDALLRAWQRWETFDPARGTPSAWLLAITADTARKANRRRRPILALSTFAAPASSKDATLDVERAVGRLSRRQRLAVDCYYFADLSVSETAAVMRCSVGTVKSTLADARARLRDLLETYGG
jgi:RNA polymerase sigma-70 factor, ECF subfamily